MAELNAPADPFAPFEPSADQPWDRRRVGHLLRRAALGAKPELVDSLLKMKPGEAIDSLLDFDPAVDPFNDQLDQLSDFFQFSKPDEAQDWWFHRMLNTPHPAQERMALFWHNHFATSALKVDNPRYMNDQIDLFRQMGLGSFRELVVAVGKGPAMLVWLDGQSNRKGKPNENYGREIMELFTLGIGNYTEQDVKQLARAFTGWTIDGNKGVFAKAQFDDGEKQIFGVKGKFDMPAAVDLILTQPAAPKFLARKLLKGFVHPNPTDDQVNYVAGRLVNQKWEIKPVLKEIFASRLFFSDWAYRSKIKSPMDLVVGAVVAFGGRANTDFLRGQTARMGQNILFPPNVKGWDGQEAWINSNTVLVRFNFGMTLTYRRTGAEYLKKPDLEGWLTTHNIKSAEDLVDHFADRLLDGPLAPEAKTELMNFMNQGPDGKPKPFVLTHETYNEKVRGIVHLMMAMPEYQLA